MARVPGGFGINDVMGVRRGPSRAVSLGDVREQPVQRMGFDFDEFDRLISEGTSETERHPWDLVEDPETGELVERGTDRGFDLPEVVSRVLERQRESGRDEPWWVHARVMGEIAEADLPLFEDPSDLVWDEIEAQLTPGGAREADQEEAEWYTGEREWGEDRSVGLSARDRALVQSPLAMAGGGQESLPGLSPEEIQYDINRRGIDEARRILEEARRRAEEKAKEPRPAGPPPQQGPPIPPRPDQLDAIRYALLAAGVGGAGMGAMRTFGGGGILGGLGSGMSLR